MYFKQKPLSTAIGCAVAGVATLGFAPTAVFAQGVDPALEEVLVTGSRIRRADLDSASPVTVLSREDMVVSGVTDIGSLLQRLPSAAGSPIGTTTNNGGDGSVRVDLRGMGTGRTLTLVNGKRTVDGGDYQTIPSNMIDRVEILKDGASAVYGADAVAGVVNIITRDTFEGLEITAQLDDWDKTNGGSQNSLGLLAGKEFDGGNIVFGVEHISQEEAYQRDTPWEFMQDSFYIYPAGCENTLLEPYASGGCYRAGSSRIPESRLTFLNQGNFLIGTPAAGPNQAGLMIPHDGRNYNYAPVNYMQTPFERTNVFATANFELNDSVRFKSEFRGNIRNSAQELAPMPYNSPTDPGHAGTFDGVAYNGIHQDNFYLRQAVDRFNAATGGSLVYEPIRDARRRMIETTRRFTQDNTQFQVDLGLEGEFNDMNWDVYANRGYQSTGFADFGQFSGPRLHDAMGPSADLNGDGIPECYGDITDASTIVAGCVPFNFFGGGSVTRETGVITATSLTPEMINYVQVDLSDQLRAEQSQFGANLAGSFGELAGGEIGWAVGANYRREEGTFIPDSQKAQGAVTGNTGTGTSGAQSNTSVYGEFLAPLSDKFLLKGGVRWDDFSTFGDDTTYQLGFEWEPIEHIKARGTYGTVFRAPGIFALFSGQQDNFPTISDPCAVQGGVPLPAGCARVAVQLDTQVLAINGGNPNLQPETGETYTAGVVWTPELNASNLSMTLDYWKIDIEDGIGSLGTQNILNQCHNAGLQNACDLITRRPGDFSIAQVLNTSLNLTSQGAEGVDLEIRWDRETSIGMIEGNVLWTHALERTKTSFPGDPEQDLQGRYTDPTASDGGARPDDKISYSLGWSNDSGLKVTYLGEFIGGMDGDTAFGLPGDGPNGLYVQDIGSDLYHDLTVSYDFNENLSVAGGITNFTNEEPPFIDVGFNGKTDPATYREFGRGYYFRFKYSM